MVGGYGFSTLQFYSWTYHTCRLYHTGYEKLPKQSGDPGTGFGFREKPSLRIEWIYPVVAYRYRSEAKGRRGWLSGATAAISRSKRLPVCYREGFADTLIISVNFAGL